jgi:hypothetical protein
MYYHIIMIDTLHFLNKSMYYIQKKIRDIGGSLPPPSNHRRVSGGGKKGTSLPSDVLGLLAYKGETTDI